MKEKALIQSVLQEQMPDFEAVRQKCIQSQSVKRGLPIYRIAFAGALCCLVLLFSFPFFRDIWMPKLMKSEISDNTEYAAPMEEAVKEEKMDTASAEMAVERNRFDAKSKDFGKEKLKGEAKAEIHSETDATETEMKKEEKSISKEAMAPANPESNVIIFNQLESYEKADLDVKIVERSKEQAKEWGFAFLETLNLPADFRADTFAEVYTARSREDTEYTLLNHYQTEYQSKGKSREGERRVIIRFSEEFTPLRDNFLETDSEPKSHLGNTELSLYSYKDLYLAYFTYEQIQFDVESHGLSETEFTELLKSIIQETNR